MEVKRAIVLIGLLGWSIGALAVCEFKEGNQQSPVNFVIPSNLSVPRDAPNGTVIFESTDIILGSINSSYRCSTAFTRGAKNNVGTTTPGANSNPIGNTGIAWKIIWTGWNIELLAYPDGVIREPGNWGFNGVGYRLQLVKVGAVTGSTIIPSGILGYFQIGEIAPLSFQTNGATLTPATCETPDINVQMGTYTLSAIGIAPGSSSEPVAFGIKLNNCPAGINTISYRFKRVGETAGFQKGIIRLNSSSTAKGIGIQIKHANGQPAVIDGVTQKVYDAYDTKGGDFEIPMTAAYYHIENEELQSGTANAELNFLIDYL